MGNLTCCESLAKPKCAEQVFEPLYPTFNKLWHDNAQPIAYCNSNIIQQYNNLPAFNSSTCGASTYSFFKGRKGKECFLPQIDNNLMDAFCNVAYKEHVLSWLAGSCSSVLLVMWVVVIWKICSSDEKASRK